MPSSQIDHAAIRILEKARALLTTKTWIRKKLFVGANAIEAEQFCALGALAKAELLLEEDFEARIRAKWAAQRIINYRSLAWFNDYEASSVEDIHALFDRAIEELSYPNG